MDKNRPLPPDIFTDEELIALPIAVRMTAIGLHFHADDQGRQTATTWQLKGAIWPGNPEMTEDAIVEHMLQLEEVGYLILYSDAARTYFSLTRWPRPNHPLPSKFPEPPADRRRPDGEPPADRSAGERARAESEWREPSAESPDGLPPSPFCRMHRPSGSGGVPCVHCQDARLAFKVWESEQRAAHATEEER